MPNPKRRHSKTRGRKRRTHYKATALATAATTHTHVVTKQITNGLFELSNENAESLTELGRNGVDEIFHFTSVYRSPKTFSGAGFSTFSRLLARHRACSLSASL